MPTAPLAPCLVPTCSNRGVCAEHAVTTSRGWRWSTVIAPAILERDGHRCALCGVPCPHATGGRGHHDIDHIVAYSQGGSDAPDNLRTVCAHRNRGGIRCSR